MLKSIPAVFAACLLAFNIAFAADKINLNTASVDELQMLDGVGPATANAIVQYREQQGEFKSVNELAEVKGIGEKKMEKLTSQVKISAE